MSVTGQSERLTASSYPTSTEAFSATRLSITIHLKHCFKLKTLTSEPAKGYKILKEHATVLDTHNSHNH